MQNKLSLEEFLEDENNHCYKCIKGKNEQLSNAICEKIKNTLTTRLDRILTTEEFKVFLVFTGVKKIKMVQGVNIHIGTSDHGMLHLLSRHFRENGDRYGGKIDYTDIIKIPDILLHDDHVVQSNGNKKYTYEDEDGKILHLVTYEYHNKWFLDTLFSSDIK